MPLTDTAIRNAKPREKAYKLSDSGGLYLHVSTTGARLWRYSYKLHGKWGLYAIGQYPEISLTEAREVHRSQQFARLGNGVVPQTWSPRGACVCWKPVGVFLSLHLVLRIVRQPASLRGGPPPPASWPLP